MAALGVTCVSVAATLCAIAEDGNTILYSAVTGASCLDSVSLREEAGKLMRTMLAVTGGPIKDAIVDCKAATFSGLLLKAVMFATSSRRLPCTIVAEG